MTLRTLGTNSNASLNCLTSFSQVLAAADVAAISASITEDSAFASILGQAFASGADAVLSTSASHTNTTLDTLVATGGAGLASIQLGDLVLKADVPPGTYVVAIPTAASVTLSQAATGTNAGRAAFIRPAARGAGGIAGVDPSSGQLYVPNRGALKILPGDVVAVDPATGWPILVSAAAISYAGSLWTLT